MKTQTNIALEGTCNGDVTGGLLSWTGEDLQALLFWKGRSYRPEKKRAAQALPYKDSPNHNIAWRQ